MEQRTTTGTGGRARVRATGPAGRVNKRKREQAVRADRFKKMTDYATNLEEAARKGVTVTDVRRGLHEEKSTMDISPRLARYYIEQTWREFVKTMTTDGAWKRFPELVRVGKSRAHKDAEAEARHSTHRNQLLQYYATHQIPVDLVVEGKSIPYTGAVVRHVLQHGIRLMCPVVDAGLADAIRGERAGWADMSRGHRLAVLDVVCAIRRSSSIRRPDVRAECLHHRRRIMDGCGERADQTGAMVAAVSSLGALFRHQTGMEAHEEYSFDITDGYHVRLGRSAGPRSIRTTIRRAKVDAHTILVAIGVVPALATHIVSFL